MNKLSLVFLLPLLCSACIFKAATQTAGAQVITITAADKKLMVPDTVKNQLSNFIKQQPVSGAGGGNHLLLTLASKASAFNTGRWLAAQMKKDLYRVNLAAITGKYIGETENNLDKVFSAAEARGVILFFDEADALFGKRTEVKDVHDKYANQEINYLLQKIEQYSGVVILPCISNDCLRLEAQRKFIRVTGQ